MSHSTNHEHDEQCAKYHVHTVPLWMLGAVLVALLILTGLTVLVSEMNLNEIGMGDIALFVALAVAVVKASLVMLFFMHLWWDSAYNSLAAVMSFAFVALFIGLTILDTAEYKQNIQEYRQLKGEPKIPTGSAAGEKKAEAN